MGSVFQKGLARETRCRWPPESPSPISPIMREYPSPRLMDKTVHGGHAPGFFHFRVGSVRTADAYIIRHGAAEQNGILGNQR